MVGHEGVQRGRGGVGHRRHPDPAEPARLDDLHSDRGEDLLALGPSGAQPWFLPADEGSHRPPPSPTAAPGPGGPGLRVAGAASPKRSGTNRSPACVADSGPDAVLARGEQPAGVEPHRQRCSRPVEHRARSHRSTSTTPFAHKPILWPIPSNAIWQQSKTVGCWRFRCRPADMRLVGRGGRMLPGLAYEPIRWAAGLRALGRSRIGCDTLASNAST